MSWRNIRKNYNMFNNLLIILNILISYLFLVTNRIRFRAIFELIMLPLLIMIYVWGSRARKLRAIRYFYTYSTVSLFLFFIGIGILLSKYNCANLGFIDTRELTFKTQNIVFISFLVPFLVKLPICPFHL